VARLNIVKEPNPLLRKVSKPVTDFSSRFHELIADMAETMLTAGGIGIAAIQVGVLYRAAVLSTEQYGILEIVNPKILTATRQKIGIEGCLSCPGINGRVKRPQLMTIEFADRFGNTKILEFHNRDAVAAAHEIDHMNGILFTDKIQR
jgi:peptide deformylase